MAKMSFLFMATDDDCNLNPKITDMLLDSTCLIRKVVCRLLGTGRAPREAEPTGLKRAICLTRSTYRQTSFNLPFGIKPAYDEACL